MVGLTDRWHLNKALKEMRVALEYLGEEWSQHREQRVQRTAAGGSCEKRVVGSEVGETERVRGERQCADRLGPIGYLSKC